MLRREQHPPPKLFGTGYELSRGHRRPRCRFDPVRSVARISPRGRDRRMAVGTALVAIVRESRRGPWDRGKVRSSRLAASIGSRRAQFCQRCWRCAHMRLVSIDRRRESLHVGLSLCEGRAPTDRGIQRNDDYEQDEKNESTKCPTDHSQQPRFLSRNTERNKNADKRDDHHEAHSNVRRIEYRSKYRSDRHKKTFNGNESSAELVSDYPTAQTERKCSPLLFGHSVEVLPSRLRARFVLTLHPWVSGAAASRKDAFSICDLLLHPRAGEDLRTWEEGPLVRVACPFAPLKRRGSVVEPEEAAELTARLELCPRQH